MPPVAAAADWLTFLYSQGPGFALAVALCATGLIYAINKGWLVPGQYYVAKVAEAAKWEQEAREFNALAKETVKQVGRSVGIAPPIRKRGVRREDDASLD